MSELLKDLAKLVGGDITGDQETLISGVSDIKDADEGDIVFAETPKLIQEASESRASAIIVGNGTPDCGKPLILVENPRLAIAAILEVFSSEQQRRNPGINPVGDIGQGSSIGDNPSIGYGVSIGENVTIGDNVWIFPLVFIGNNVRIGSDCVIHPFVSIYDNTVLGDRVIIHSGSVIGADGFSYTKKDNKHYKIPHIGGVSLGDDVEIGANVTVDRARTGKTRIGRGTKVDNLTHIAHNCSIGEDCIVIAHVGISGSVNVGDRVIIAGQAGLKEHVNIGNDAVVLGQAGVMGDIEPGAMVSGYPARDHKQHLKVVAAQMKVPDLLRTVKDLERRLSKLEEHSE